MSKTLFINMDPNHIKTMQFIPFPHCRLIKAAQETTLQLDNHLNSKNFLTKNTKKSLNYRDFVSNLPVKVKTEHYSYK